MKANIVGLSLVLATACRPSGAVHEAPKDAEAPTTVAKVTVDQLTKDVRGPKLFLGKKVELTSTVHGFPEHRYGKTWTRVTLSDVVDGGILEPFVTCMLPSGADPSMDDDVGKRVTVIGTVKLEGDFPSLSWCRKVD